MLVNGLHVSPAGLTKFTVSSYLHALSSVHRHVAAKVVQGARRVVPHPRRAGGGGRVPQGAGQERAGPVAAVAGGRRRREHDDQRPAVPRRGRGRRSRRRPRGPDAVAVARHRAARRRGSVHEVPRYSKGRRGPADVRWPRRIRRPGTGEESVRRHLEHVDQELLQGQSAPAEHVQLSNRSVNRCHPFDDTRCHEPIY